MAHKTRKKWKWPRILLSVLLVLFLLGNIGLVVLEKYFPNQTFIPRKIVRLPSQVISTVIKPFQQVTSWATSGVSGYLKDWKFRKTLEMEYNKVKQQNDQLIYDSLLNTELEAENDRLRSKLGEYEARRAMNPVLARVTAKEAGNWFSIFTIDKGKKDGIQKDMAVINELGLIGRVYEVFDHASQVVTIIDSRSSIGAVIESTRDQGIVKGTLGVEQEATCRMYYLPVNLVPRPGDTVVSSGVGLPFPKGLKIGVVRESTRHMDESKHYIVVEPYVDFMHIEEVLVLLYQADPEDMPAADDGQLDYVPVALDTPRPVPQIGQESITNASATLTPLPRPSREPAVTLPPTEDALPATSALPTTKETPVPSATATPDPELDPAYDD
ncbi:MAG: rod shape-determining protein MreC, partial [Clostridia bacterium]